MFEYFKAMRTCVCVRVHAHHYAPPPLLGRLRQREARAVHYQPAPASTLPLGMYADLTGCHWLVLYRRLRTQFCTT